MQNQKQTNPQSDTIAVVLHQLKTPLVAIKWSLKMLLDKSIGPLNEEQESIISEDLINAERAIQEIQGILKADRIDRHELVLHLDAVNIAHVAESKIKQQIPTAEAKKISLKTDFERDLPETISLDADRIADVFQNLISNAICYTPKGGLVTVGIKRENESILVWVKDTGIGISPDHQASIFTKFYRTPNGAKSDPSGTGLGLYIAKSIVEKHGGKIWFESTAKKGTTFYFSLPIN
jgi:signal transduction histidine kinase